MRFFVVAATTLLISLPASALEAYSPALTDQFVGWCTGTQDQPQTVCSCAVNKAALEIPASGLASFLSAAEGGGVAAVSQGVGATAIQIVATCAAGSGSAATGGGGVMNSLGGMLKR